MTCSDFLKLVSAVTICSSCFTVNHTVAAADAGSRQDDKNQHRGSILVSPQWLENEIRKSSNLRIIDLPLRATNYKEGHIPGAVYLDWRSDIIGADERRFYRLPSKDEMEKLLSRVGIDPDTTVVLTDNMGNRTAVRMYYTLKYFGHEDVRILNGGTKNWEKSNRKLVTEVPEIEPSSYQIKTTRSEFVAAMEAVQEAIDDETCRLIDGRPGDQFSGEKPGKAFHTNNEHARRGHVPKAVSIPWTENLNEDGTFKSLTELRKLYLSHGINPDDEVITYCNEGLHAAMPWFILRELMGNRSVSVYDDSMVEWANREDTPMIVDEGRGSK